MLLISRRALQQFRLGDAFFLADGRVGFASFYAARSFAECVNRGRDLRARPEQATRAGQLNALSLIDDILRYVVTLYSRIHDPQLLQHALGWLHDHVGQEAVERALLRFVSEFPPLAVYRGELDVQAYLEQRTQGVSHRELALLDLVMLWLANRNPAASPLANLFNDALLIQETAYLSVIASLYHFLATQPPFGPHSQNLLDMLRSPAVAVPHSLAGQLEYIRQWWGYLLGSYLDRLLIGIDLIQEEERPIFPGPGPSQVLEFRGVEDLEVERFSRDRDWMPRLVLLAKNTYVWLDQLSKQYGRALTRLDQIPDEVLDTLARWGFTGLWLIGVWERSRASQRIKQLCGNPEAVASAYSLFDYQIAADLGGQEAFENLKFRAGRRGIRLATDMVPNHMGIDSRWVIEHPDWFISLDHSPFPSYTFNGPDLSSDIRVGIYLEDHYYDRSDAAVVFKRVDRWTGEERYIYHGNDGTSMPWNDTAQLNYLNPTVREAVIQTILHVARQFPIIRFDAAMTLTKRHYQRLWFPEPGTGGAIPSRSEYGLTKAEFDRLMPNEFWREVVDRVTAEAPDTLLLAEAFWLLEGYFVRTLGMHRVYNSAFMNMLRDEDNARYRQLIKNTLEFDPRILKRYVNFMNNPDERTAVDQFGKGDKYFGICTMLATMPGLPMFGHGQIEGFAEKYGMEYRRAYWDEQPDPALVERHEREIFPLLRRRYLFAEVENFFLYDLVTPSGEVNEDVFAYSNRFGGERALIVYHNRYADTRGWIRSSVPYAPLVRGPQHEEPGEGTVGQALVTTSLCNGLALHPAEGVFVIFRDHRTGLEYIRSTREMHEQGLFVELGAYQYHVFLDFREVQDDSRGTYAELAAYLGGQGVPSIEKALQEMRFRPVLESLRQLISAEVFHSLIQSRMDPVELGRVLGRVERSLAHLFETVEQVVWEGGYPFRFTGEASASPLTPLTFAAKVRSQLEVALSLHAVMDWLDHSENPLCRWASEYIRASLGLPSDLLSEFALAFWDTLLCGILVHALGMALGEREGAAGGWLDKWNLGPMVATALREFGLDATDVERSLATVKVLASSPAWSISTSGDLSPPNLLTHWLGDADAQSYLQVNYYEGARWFNKEAFERLTSWTMLIAIVARAADWPRDQGLAEDVEGQRQIEQICAIGRELDSVKEASGYQVDRLMEAFQHR